MARNRPTLDETEIAATLAAIREADVGGPFVSNEAMIAWLRSWGRPDELPPPKPDVFLRRR